MRAFGAMVGIAALATAGLLGAAIGQPGQTPGKPDPVAAAMPAGSYVLDPHHASLIARVKHQGFSMYSLRFTGLEASFDYDPARAAATRLSVKVATASIDTATGADPFGKAFDAELLAPDWLDEKQFPTMTFNSTAIDLGDGRAGTVTGDLTFHGVTKQVTLNVVFNGSGKGIPGGEIRAGFSATGAIKRSDFGVKKFLPGVGDDIQLVIEAEFQKK